MSRGATTFEARTTSSDSGLTGQNFAKKFCPVKTWPLQNAKNQFSQVVELALTEGPQTVTRHGQPVAVIVSADEFKKITRPKENIVEFFAPLRGSGVRLGRHRDLPRKLKL
ncbi:MAG: type II toxin-antitoxin system Phd/YefM family antitoxin [Verrucomicrobia bacterium]|nr:type II toxin-antitoxin system Phd/YefM family antitoxin [Verrucomicrobiota bacterium]